ncbi:MAG TPA: hypothetical protein DHV63_02300 [Pseudomonas sp.]|nr:hypothetical protein [Pseudomonas sp.]
METRWNYIREKVVCFSVTFNHAIFKVPVLGPFASGAAAGAAMDSLLKRYPDATIRLDRVTDPALRKLSRAELDNRAELAEILLEVALTEPFSVVEGIGRSAQEYLPEHAAAIAERVGCSVGDIVVFEGANFEGDPMWIAFRRHLQTTDRMKAETQALWRRRELEQNGLSGECISVVTLPLVVPSLGV